MQAVAGLANIQDVQPKVQMCQSSHLMKLSHKQRREWSCQNLGGTRHTEDMSKLKSHEGTITSTQVKIAYL